jgi:hypothetical protein
VVTTAFDILVTAMTDLGLLTAGEIDTTVAHTTVHTETRQSSARAWKGGTMFVLEADAAAPEKEWAKISASSFDSTTGKTTYTTSAFTAVLASGDKIALSSSKYPIDEMLLVLNRALSSLGEIPLVDDTLAGVTGQSEYSLPSGVGGRNLRRVFVTGDVDSTGDMRWTESVMWRSVPATAGAVSTLIFRNYPDDGETIRLVYMGSHPACYAASSAISDYVAKERLVAEFNYRFFLWAKRRGTDMDEIGWDLNEATAAVEYARKRWGIGDPGTPFKPVMSPIRTHSGGRVT